MTNRLSQGEVIVGGLEVEQEAQTNSLVVETQATVNDLQDELHNVLISNPQEGQVLKYSASAGGVWRNQTP